MRSNKGGVAIEFAFVLPLLIILLFGIIEFGLIIYDKAIITNASREGARAGIVMAETRLSSSEIINIVNSYCSSYLITFGSSPSPASTVVDGAGGSFGNNLTVTVTYTYRFLVIPQFVTTITGPITLTARTVMRME